MNRKYQETKDKSDTPPKYNAAFRMPILGSRSLVVVNPLNSMKAPKTTRPMTISGPPILRCDADPTSKDKDNITLRVSPQNGQGIPKESRNQHPMWSSLPRTQTLSVLADDAIRRANNGRRTRLPTTTLV